MGKERLLRCERRRKDLREGKEGGRRERASKPIKKTFSLKGGEEEEERGYNIKRPASFWGGGPIWSPPKKQMSRKGERFPEGEDLLLNR